jgi:transketolase
MNAKQRIIEISYKHNLSHLGTCFTALPIIKKIYQTKKQDEKFILSQGHAGLALYVILEEMGLANAEDLLVMQGVHPDRRKVPDLIDCSTGSLGCGLPIAVGMALADKTKNVYCLISDGECAEGSIWESLELIRKLKLTNLVLYVNVNGFCAYDSVDTAWLERRLALYGFPIIVKTNVKVYPFLNGVDAHYHVMSKTEYESTLS